MMKSMKKHVLNIAALALLLGLGATACNRDSVDNDDSQVEAAQSSTEASGTVEDLSDEAEMRLAPNANITGCPTVTYAQAQGTFPNTITIDFGTGCTTQNGRTVSGQIIVDVTGAYFTQGSVRTTHTDNLTVDGNEFEYTRVVTNQGLNGGGQMYWSVEVSGTRLRASDGSTAEWTASRTRTMVEGAATSDDMLDDAYEITGGGSGTCHDGRAFTTTITTPLLKRADCRWIVQGVEQMTVDGRRGTRSIDFGDGTCDDKATLTLRNGDTREITLHRPR